MWRCWRSGSLYDTGQLINSTPLNTSPLASIPLILQFFSNLTYDVLPPSLTADNCLQPRIRRPAADNRLRRENMFVFPLLVGGDETILDLRVLKASLERPMPTWSKRAMAGDEDGNLVGWHGDFPW